MRKIILLNLTFILSVTMSASATVRLVPDEYATIQAAIDDCNDGDVVIIAPGTYTGDGNRDLKVRGKAITVRSSDPNDPNIVASTTIDCQANSSNMHRGFYFYRSRTGKDSVIAGLTITNGFAIHGGAICCDEYSSPIITHCRLIGNHAMRGGGIYVDYGTPIITHCIIIGNSVSSESYRGEGGGIYCGIYTNLVISDCTIISNSASGFRANLGAGGGIHLSNNNATVRHCTVVGNSAEIGGGIYCNEYATITITNCIVWGNSATTSPEIAGTPAISYSNVQGGYSGTGNINTDPLFVNPVRGDYHLSVHSPCIDAGDREFVPFFAETDIDGEPRVMGMRVDIGSDEFSALPTPIIGISPKAFAFHADEAGPNPESQILSVYSAGFGNLLWTVTENGPWLEIYPSKGESFGKIDAVNLSVDVSGLALGEHTCELTITAQGASNTPQKVPVTLYVRPVSGQLHVPSEYKTIQSAINAAQEGDIIIIAEGIYIGDGNRDLDFRGKAITVRSTDPNNPAVVAATVIDCQDAGRAFNFHSGEGPNSILSGVMITNGAAEYGAGIYIRDAGPTITHCLITGNRCDQRGRDGGGLYIRNGSPIIRQCTISNNSATSVGGGIFCYDSSPVVDNCGVLRCRARDGGGAISVWYQSKPIISRCIIIGNSVTFRSGGAIGCRNSQPLIYNCVIADNSAAEGGGGLCLSASDSAIINCTITGNTADWRGGGIYFSLGTADIANCIIWGNTSPQAPEIGVYSWSGVIVDRGSGNINPEGHRSVLALSYSTLKTGTDAVRIYGDPDFLLLQWGPGNLDTDPCFVSAGYWDPNGTPDRRWDDVWIDGDYHLKSQAGRWNPNNQSWVKDDVTSPCIDAGNRDNPIGFEPFPNGGVINMGAYGGTAQASKSYFGEPVCETIVAGDINGDCKVDFLDFELMALHWLEDKNSK